MNSHQGCLLVGHQSSWWAKVANPASHERSKDVLQLTALAQSCHLVARGLVDDQEVGLAVIAVEISLDDFVEGHAEVGAFVLRSTSSS